MGRLNWRQLALFADDPPNSVVEALDTLPERRVERKKIKRGPSKAQIESRIIFGPGENWPDGFYYALDCDCYVEVRSGRYYKSPCQDHPDLSGAKFVEPDVVDEKKSLRLQLTNRYNKTPFAKLPDGYEELLRKLFVRWDRKKWGNPEEFEGQTITLDKPYDCGCIFVLKPYQVKHLWMVTKGWRWWAAVRIGSCGKPDGECKCSAYPIFDHQVKIGLVLRQRLKERG